MYTRQGLTESHRRFTQIKEAFTFAPKGLALTSPEEVLIAAMLNMIDSHVEALNEIERLNEKIADQDDDLRYWANR